MGQNSDLGTADTIVVAAQSPTLRHRDAEGLEESPADTRSVHVLGGSSEEQRVLVFLEGHERLEGCRLIPVIHEVRVRDAADPHLAARRRGADRDEAFGLGERQRPQQHGVDDAEQRRSGADADGQGEDRDGGEPRLLRGGTHGETQIGDE